MATTNTSENRTLGYSSLNNLLNWKDGVPNPKTNLLLIDTFATEANFLFNHFITNYIQQKSPVLFVGFKNIFNHYNLILKKMGCNLLLAKKSNLFYFIDGFTQLTSSEKIEQNTANVDLTLQLNLKDKERVLSEMTEKLVDLIQSAAQSSPSGQLGALMIDDLSTLFNCGVSTITVINMLKRLKVELNKVGSSLIVLVHGDKELSESTEHCKFIQLIMNQFMIWFKVEPLPSGYSRDVDGQMSIYRGYEYYQSPTQIEPNLVHFQLKDTSVEFFNRGTSKNVL
ncbi:hypothetical protein CONCODRAFT_114710 [Conidiobolus coronatus NRRL 28638]|uniref:Elongator complex protein 6 n=1 Tax=Conidiobolus coronatus (strain ATCC 28846 / CBS 209.66 / NRRL 28638) TaxID=796925 RepID=A0A137PEF8_CONC2|nr:hypothetical protein CONCODRAFT_114710 [Conidiobolus coronatus NRRL 28638]|eukprot:KXN73355.1 hypothetical protein CONCODRAFT_114710 [Conidiobolus coronatus NRRL 28638]